MVYTRSIKVVISPKFYGILDGLKQQNKMIIVPIFVIFII